MKLTETQTILWAYKFPSGLWEPIRIIEKRDADHWLKHVKPNNERTRIVVSRTRPKYPNPPKWRKVAGVWTTRAPAQRKRLCPVCGKKITIVGKTTDGRSIGSCGDAFRTQASNPYANFNRFSIKLTKAQAESVSGQGAQDENVKALMRVPSVKRELNKIDPAALRAELKEYGAWDESELADHDDNLARILWIAGGNIKEDSRNPRRKRRMMPIVAANPELLLLGNPRRRKKSRRSRRRNGKLRLRSYRRRRRNGGPWKGYHKKWGKVTTHKRRVNRGRRGGYSAFVKKHKGLFKRMTFRQATKRIASMWRKK